AANKCLPKVKRASKENTKQDLFQLGKIRELRNALNRKWQVDIPYFGKDEQANVIHQEIKKG
ncbi:14334_t:CDS:2, partial [Gigaspora rosea]